MSLVYPAIASVEKTSIEARWLSINWKVAYPSVAISVTEWTVEGLTLVTEGVTGSVTRALVSGGAKNTPAYAENKITLADGEIRVARINVEVF